MRHAAEGVCGGVCVCLVSGALRGYKTWKVNKVKIQGPHQLLLVGFCFF